MIVSTQAAPTQSKGLSVAPHVMVVEDDSALSLLLRYNLEAEGYHVTTALRGDEAETLLSEASPDLLILDWMLPSVSGLELCRRLRARRPMRDLPIIMLTARGEEHERVRGLSIGADDYVVKPFSVPELMARVRSLLRRTNPQRISDCLEASDLRLQKSNRRVYRGGRELHLGPTEFKLLQHLMEHPGRVASRASLVDAIWGGVSDIDERTVDVHIGRLRKAINRTRERDPIRTVRGIGYSFDETFGKG
jgi:two-component system phosphate regulon response regulator PhoB